MRGLKQNLLGIFLAAFILWLVFFLVNGLPNSSFVGPEIIKECVWTSVSWDSNLDGVFSYSDVPIWFASVFISFQKFLVANLYDTTLGQFIELKKNACTSFKAQAISYVTLLLIFFFISKSTLSAANTLIPKIKSIQQKNSLPSAISYLVSSRNFIESIWSLHFKLIFVALTFIIIGLNWHTNKANPPLQEKRAVVKKETSKLKGVESGGEVSLKDEALKEEAKILAEKEEARLLADKEEQDKLKAAKAEALKAAEEEAARIRAAILKDAQNLQEQQRIAEQNRQVQLQKAQQEKVASNKRKWAARCEFDKKNAYEQYMKAHEFDCNNPKNRSLGALCALGVISAANDYAAAAYNSCMSGAPD
jgi:hypothetical protein